jgi:glucokinase
LGIEIGGTKLQLGVGHGQGAELATLVRRDIDAARGATGILEQIEAETLRLLQRYEISRVGIGFGGPVDAAAGRAIISHQVAGWENFALADWCHNRLRLPAVVGNDCDVAALAEAQYGAGRDRQSVFYVTVGTGIGGGFVTGGALHGIGRPAVAEIGHLRPGPLAEDPSETVESIASGMGIAERAMEIVRGTQRGAANDANGDDGSDQADCRDLIERAGGHIETLTGKQVGHAAVAGNKVAVDVIHQASRVLGWAIAQTITLLAPEAVVIGGGVSLLGEDLFLNPVRESTKCFVFPPLVDSYQISPAALGELVVVHGAIALAAANNASGR